MKISEERRLFIKNKVLKCLRDSRVGYLPIPIEDVIFSVPHINIVKYSTFMSDFGLSLQKTLLAFESADACAVYSPVKGGGIIYYNDLDKDHINTNRYRWSLAHELGHIVLGHHTNEKTRLYRSKLSKKEYKELEYEADYFAQLILVPHACLCNFRITNYHDILRKCKLSDWASRVRYGAYKEWRENLDKNDEYDLAIFSIFYDYSFKKRCSNCGGVVVQRHGKYCIFCGKAELRWSEDRIMKYNSADTYGNGKLKICPKCKNEETNVEGFYCQICGIPLNNHCINHPRCLQGILPSNARFCPICGERSYFYKNEFIHSYDYVPTSYFDIPEGIEEELPFN